MAFIFDGAEREYQRKALERFHTDQRQSAADPIGAGDTDTATSLPRILTRCHLHPDQPLRQCPECVTAVRVNAMSHLRGNCIPGRCVWHQTGIKPYPELVW